MTFSLCRACLLVLVGLFLNAAPAAAQEVSEAPAPRDTASVLRSGPMVGFGTHRTTALWVQTRRTADVQFRVWPLGQPDSSRTTPVLRADAAGDHIAQHEVAFLEPGRRYEYEVVVDGQAVERPYPQRFQTQELWQWRTDPPTFTVAFGSCTYINDPRFDRPGDGYGGGYDIFETIAGMNPDLMLWLGDNVYYREVDWQTPKGMAYRYAHTRATPEMQPLLARTHHYATWDDHDYGPNNSDRSYVLKGTALDVFQRYWANPTYGLPSEPGVFTHFTWADVDFFLLDDRYHRAPTTAPRDSGKVIWGERQMQWLIDALTTSEAAFKVVVNGGQILNPYDFYEMLARYPQRRAHLLSAIQERQIEGVVFLSGDRHHTELLRLQPDGFYPLYDFTSSPLTAGVGNPTREQDNPLRVDGTLVTQRNFGTLTVSGPRTDRVMTMRTYDADGQMLWEQAVRARDLVPDGAEG